MQKAKPQALGPPHASENAEALHVVLTGRCSTPGKRPGMSLAKRKQPGRSRNLSAFLHLPHRQRRAQKVFCHRRAREAAKCKTHKTAGPHVHQEENLNYLLINVSCSRESSAHTTQPINNLCTQLRIWALMGPINVEAGA